MGRLSRKTKYFLLSLFLAGSILLILNIGNKSVFSRATYPVSTDNQLTKTVQESVYRKPQLPAGPSVSISGISIPVEVMRTDEEIRKGLSGKPFLDSKSGMLFVFSKPAIYQFWMPDMHFPIDIIWINNGKVVDIDTDVSNDFDSAHPIYYRPEVPAQYVLEVNAGFAKRSNITIGKTIVFNSIK